MRKRAVDNDLSSRNKRRVVGEILVEAPRSPKANTLNADEEADDRKQREKDSTEDRVKGSESTKKPLGRLTGLKEQSPVENGSKEIEVEEMQGFEEDEEEDLEIEEEEEEEAEDEEEGDGQIDIDLSGGNVTLKLFKLCHEYSLRHQSRSTLLAHSLSFLSCCCFEIAQFFLPNSYSECTAASCTRGTSRVGESKREKESFVLSK